MERFYPYFKLDNLNSFIAGFIILFSFLIILYSLKFIKRARFQYYTYIILTTICSLGVVLANNLIILLVLWGFLGLTLYLLINFGKDAETTAKKTFIIVGGSDCLMILGIGIIYYLTGTFQMDKIKISLTPNYYLLPTISYLCLAIACFAKAGAMPLHTWIPDCAENALIPVTAFLPASLDKLLGIYLLARMSLNLFLTNQLINLILLIVGAVTVISAVMMALIQHNAKRLLGYHAVSQVGYMVLGIGTANPIGIAGAIFHMLNNAIYKSCLFLTCGNVEYKKDTTELDQLGGLAKFMPISYISFLVASLSISGVPPFNGFVSKWMIYQGLIQNYTLHITHYTKFIFLLCLIAAMFGSALTLASFLKLTHAIFLGQCTEEQTNQRTNEVSWQMFISCIILAILCIIFGVFAFQIPLKYFILPSLAPHYYLLPTNFLGIWLPNLATFLIFLGLILGLIIFGINKVSFREDDLYLGSETKALEVSRVSGVEFYNTIKELNLLKKIYLKAEKGYFDIYEQTKKFIFKIGGFLQFLHNGVLPTYLVWCLLGMIALFFILK
jgi:formate hydrogenlyase subunit 3/multisubunit Na+/H+ antiporter MnhD subunit